VSTFNPATFARPANIKEAAKILSEEGPGARVVAGNTTLYELARQGGLSDVGILVDISKLGLSYIREEEDDDPTYDSQSSSPSSYTTLHIGSATTFSKMAQSRLLAKPSYYALKESAMKITPPQVRNMGTIGGSACSGIAFYDMPPVLLALDSKMKVFSSTTGEKTIAAKDFFVDYFMTALSPEELLTEVVVEDKPRSGSSFIKLGRTSVDFAVVNVAVRITLDESMRVISDARIGIGAISNVPVCANEASQMMIGQVASPELIRSAATLAGSVVEEPVPSVHGSSKYKKKVIPVLVRDALFSALDRITPPSNAK